MELKGYPYFLTVKDIAKILGVGYTKALTVVRYGNMPYIKIGRAFRVPKYKFVEWLNAEDKRIIDVI